MIRYEHARAAMIAGMILFLVAAFAYAYTGVSFLHVFLEWVLRTDAIASEEPLTSQQFFITVFFMGVLYIVFKLAAFMARLADSYLNRWDSLRTDRIRYMVRKWKEAKANDIATISWD